MSYTVDWIRLEKCGCHSEKSISQVGLRNFPGIMPFEGDFVDSINSFYSSYDDFIHNPLSGVVDSITAISLAGLRIYEVQWLLTYDFCF